MREIDKVSISILVKQITYEQGMKIIADIQRDCPHAKCFIINGHRICDECETVFKKAAVNER